ncbi:hypothetical protein EJ04DRAFT_486326, partial [Polyplosphaeria fusca]
MAPPPSDQSAKKGRKRAHDGKESLQDDAEAQPPAAKVPRVVLDTSKGHSKEPQDRKQQQNSALDTLKAPPQPKQKRPKLPKNAIISKRPIHRPAIPAPQSSSTTPKTLYIKPTSPFIPTIKRIRKLLSHVASRARQSTSTLAKTSKAAKANGRLKPSDVEREMVDEARRKGGGKGKGKNGNGEAVFLKASGRAIPRALEMGVWFQGEGDCVVRVEMGSVRVIDDIEVKDAEDVEDVGEGERMD